ncbi:MAG: hypothetical protein K9M03_03130 [Kiritimatiellales bacterium]|nr:hypothetical protein [Kiritimatiellales bacterium]
MNCNKNVVAAALIGIIAGTIMGIGASQYAYVVAGFNPNDAKAVEELRGAAPKQYEYTNARALRLGLDNLLRRFEIQGRERTNFDETKYAQDGPCAGMSGSRRYVCEAENK